MNRSGYVLLLIILICLVLAPVILRALPARRSSHRLDHYALASCGL